jgi:glycosyltransferase involved in cell wall biosynthesis
MKSETQFPATPLPGTGGTEEMDCSIVIPCYNQGRFLDDAITSALAQTRQPREIIVVNDASTDAETVKILSTRTWGDSVKILHNPSNLGRAGARNAGIKQATASCILPLDADDKISPTYLEHGVAVLQQRPEVGIVCGDTFLFGTRTGKANFGEFSKWRMSVDNCIVSAALFRKADWERAGGYCAEFNDGLEDWDFYLSLLEAGAEFHHLGETVLYYRQHPDSVTHKLRRNAAVRNRLYRILWTRHAKYLREHSYESLLYLREEREVHRDFGKNPLVALCRKILRTIGRYP